MNDSPGLLTLVPVALAAGANLAFSLARWRINLTTRRERQRREQLYERYVNAKTGQWLARQRSAQADQMALEKARMAARESARMTELWLREHDARRRWLRWAVRRRRSLSQLMVHGAVSRLPIEMGELEKARWEEEMGADVAAIDGRWQRLRYAFGILRRGAPKMPAGGAGVPRSVD